jgi:hypothetical protein
MTDPGDELQASHPLRDAKVVVEDIEDNPGFFRVKLYAVPHFQVEGMDVNLSLVSRCRKRKRKAGAGMKTERPLWGRGQMVSPQHFQQQAAQAAWHTECVARWEQYIPGGCADGF